MSRNRFQLLLENLHFVNNDEIDKNDNFAKIRPIIDLCVINALGFNQYSTTAWMSKLYHRKKSFQVYSNIIPKRPESGALRTWSVLGLRESCLILSFMKENQQQITDMERLTMIIFRNQHKLLQSFVRVYLAIKTRNCFLMIATFYVKNNGMLAVAIIHLTCLSGYSVSSNKDLQKAERGSTDYHIDDNFGIIIVIWVDNSIVQLVSNFVGIEPMTTIERWCKNRI